MAARGGGACPLIGPCVVPLWYHTHDGDLDEEEVNLARTEGPDLAPLECSSAAEVQRWIKESRFK